MNKHKFPDRFYSALHRNLNEVRTAILERKALIGLESVGSKHILDFFTLSYDALFNDMIAHAMKVLDKNKDSATFWYLYRCDQKTIDFFIHQESYNFQLICNIAKKLGDVRNKTHFHIDKKRVFDPKNVWKEADIKGSDFGKTLDQVFEILNYLHQVHHDEKLAMPEYDGQDAVQLISLAQEEGSLPLSANKDNKIS